MAKKLLKWIEINLSSVAGNVRAVKRRLGRRTELMAVLKADAYGHGAGAISRAARSAGADCFGVISAEEGAELRELGIREKIFILAPSPEYEIPRILKHSLVPLADRAGFLSELDRLSRKKGILSEVCVDIDYGIGRWGISPEELSAFAGKIAGSGNLKLHSVSTHIDYSSGKNMTEAQEKLSDFKRLCDGVFGAGKVKMHAANSSVLCDFPQWKMDMARIGNLIYGLYPSRIYKKPPLKGISRPWKFFCRIISVRKVRKGQSLGYASEYVAPRNMVAACVPSGYGDGLTMEPKGKDISISSGSRYWGMVNGKKAPFIGRPGIMHTLLDITGIEGVGPGDPVELPVRRTIASRRIPRFYV